MLGRIPIRLRLTFAFAGVMALLLSGAGLFIHISLENDLDDSTRRSLQTRAADVGALVVESDLEGLRGGQSPLTEGGATFAQVLDLGGRIVDATPLLRKTPLLSQTEIASAADTPLLIARRPVSGLPEPAALLATVSKPIGGPRVVVVVGAPLGERDEAIRNLSTLLVIGGPIALILASLAGYGVASAALQPVEAMRQRAAGISGGSHGERNHKPRRIARLHATNASIPKRPISTPSCV